MDNMIKDPWGKYMDQVKNADVQIHEGTGDETLEELEAALDDPEEAFSKIEALDTMMADFDGDVGYGAAMIERTYKHPSKRKKGPGKGRPQQKIRVMSHVSPYEGVSRYVRRYR